jgi:hypothetical protein
VPVRASAAIHPLKEKRLMARLNPVERRVDRFLREPPSVRNAIGTWSTHRLLDTIVGCAVALVANYLLWPRDSEADEALPTG